MYEVVVHLVICPAEMPLFLLLQDFLLFDDFNVRRKISHVTVILCFSVPLSILSLVGVDKVLGLHFLRLMFKLQQFTCNSLLAMVIFI